ncbi:hypothetical protein BJX63DRAFT_437878 [Aspergillus granulosus]|uniref:PD-(D/E)XK nuclease-like domain-containing protein n=1 Tax=Aspergillus granulosus TaxID=176169 RepID=A0ABR4GU25_9EURO
MTPEEIIEWRRFHDMLAATTPNPISKPADPPLSPSKKPDAKDGDTPKASSSRRTVASLQPASAATTFPVLESQCEQSSRTSGRSSPSKRMAALELYSEGVESRVLSLTDPNLPAPLAELLVELEKCSLGVGVISSDLRAEIDEQAKQNPSLCIYLDYMFADSADRDRIGPTPSLTDVAILVEEAEECQAAMQSEAGWNAMVHYPLLYKAIYGQRRQNQLVGFSLCTTAKVIREYLPVHSLAKMVDFCVCVHPDVDKIAFEAIKSLRLELPFNVINHTDFLPLRGRPIAISIGTKRRYSEHLATAELQLGTWHAAQWRLLEDLVTRCGGSFDGLPFLPAIIVHGHYWSFAATTRQQQTTVLWLEKCFGSTSSLLGVYRTVWGLQRLAKWVAEVYWPWFRKNALGVSTG